VYTEEMYLGKRQDDKKRKKRRTNILKKKKATEFCSVEIQLGVYVCSKTLLNSRIKAKAALACSKE
jgi:hypothetical protein